MESKNHRVIRIQTNETLPFSKYMSPRNQKSIRDNPPSSHNAVITYYISHRAKRININSHQCLSDSMAAVSQRRVYKFGGTRFRDYTLLVVYTL